jgi:thioredoxin reductase
MKRSVEKAIVIGGGIGGLTAAAYYKRASDSFLKKVATPLAG